ncbi:MAG: sulfite exporter TauE/SafE family protein [Gemmatimonadota bacterium]|nr:sulfite exporter TauE/SafE family protein [Gemmatimonadota bacterium]
MSELLLFAVGVVTGTINVLAGGGSMLSLPALIFLGLPATVANGTNRVGILVNSLGAVWGFHGHRLVPWSWAGFAIVPATIGALVGSWLATRVGDAQLQDVIAVVMLLVAVWTIWDPLKARTPTEAAVPTSARGRAVLAAAFFGIGLYGGFIQVGVGFLLLAATTFAGFDLVRGNALKVLVVLGFTLPALLTFARADMVDWRLGAILAAGNLVGGWAGVRLNVLKGHVWIRRVVLVAVLVMAGRLLLT